MLLSYFHLLFFVTVFLSPFLLTILLILLVFCYSIFRRFILCKGYFYSLSLINSSFSIVCLLWSKFLSFSSCFLLHITHMLFLLPFFVVNFRCLSFINGYFIYHIFLLSFSFPYTHFFLLTTRLSLYLFQNLRLFLYLINIYSTHFSFNSFLSRLFLSHIFYLPVKTSSPFTVFSPFLSRLLFRPISYLSVKITLSLTALLFFIWWSLLFLPTTYLAFKNSPFTRYFPFF